MVPAALDHGPRSTACRSRSIQRASAWARSIGEALRNRRFVVLCCTHFVCGLQLIFINTHLPNYLALCGQDPMLGATALAIIGGINIVGCLDGRLARQRYLKNVLLGLTYLGRSVRADDLLHVPADADETSSSLRRWACCGWASFRWCRAMWPTCSAPATWPRCWALSFVIHQMGSVMGAWGGGMIFDMFGNYDLAWRFGVLIGITAGVVQIAFGGPARPTRRMRRALATG